MSVLFQSILLVDDDNDDQLLFQEALAEVDGAVHYFIASNGIEALEKLICKQIKHILNFGVPANPKIFARL